MGLLLGIGIIVFLIIPMVPAFAQNYCWEDEDDMCGLKSNNPRNVFGSVLRPLESQLSGFALVIFWGGILGVIWLKTENIMILGIVGIMVSATITGLSSTAQGIGMLLLAISIGILLFQLIRQRIALIS